MRVILSKSERLWKMPQSALGEMRFTEKRLEARNVERIDLQSFQPRTADKIAPLNSQTVSIVQPASNVLLGQLKAKILACHHSLNKTELDADKEIIITPGIRSTAALLALGLLNPGDSAAYPDPGMQYFRAAINLADGSARKYSLVESNDYILNIESLKSTAHKKTKILFLNYPHNPTGVAVDYYFYRELLRALRFANILTVADCAYIHPGNPDISVPLQVRNANRMVVEMHSFSTSFGIPGLGFAAGHKDAISILNTLMSLHGFCPLDSQVRLAISGLDNADAIFNANMELFRVNRELLSDGLKQLDWQVKGGRLVPFIWTRPPFRSTSIAFSRRLFAKAGIRVAPGSDFGEGGEGWIRMSLWRNEADLREAIQRLSEHSKIWQRKYRP
jgi:LL-diaminopimelate aminotransferase